MRLMALAVGILIGCFNTQCIGKTAHEIECDLDPWFREQYAKHHSQKSGAFSVEEITEIKGKNDK